MYGIVEFTGVTAERFPAERRAPERAGGGIDESAPDAFWFGGMAGGPAAAGQNGPTP